MAIVDFVLKPLLGGKNEYFLNLIWYKWERPNVLMLFFLYGNVIVCAIVY